MKFIIIGIISFFSLLSQLIIAKVVAVYTSIEVFGLLGQFLSFLTLVQLLTGGVIRTGVVKYISEFNCGVENSKEKVMVVINTSLSFTVLISILTSLLIFSFSKELSVLLFKNIDYSLMFKVFSIFLVGFAINQLTLAIFNGLGRIYIYALLNIISSILYIMFIVVLTFLYGFEGCLYGFIVGQFFLFIASILFLSLGKINVRFELDKCVLNKLLKFSAISISSAIWLPLSQIFLRYHVASSSSWQETGYWQAVIKISDAYLYIFNMMISVLVLPVYSSIQNNQQLKKEMFKFLNIIGYLVCIAAVAIYVAKSQIISILFSKEYLEVTHIIGYQLIGDAFKTLASVIVFIFIAKAKVRLFICVDFILTLFYVLISLVFYTIFSGIQGLTVAFAITYMLYFVIIFLMVLNYLKKG
ncbi:O antigen flippase [Francisella cf. novicida Fx1]|uniref:O-antigen translocase n=1 Tax=Francisella tularensis TaxID=263 RepID=UPI00020BCE55|nr:O-antigen translocase [Francisella tularensis]AEE87842.1 O antigen flippase [Francisella cf. novicida Fx1]